MNWQDTQKKTEVKYFLDLVIYYRIFIKICSKIAKLLTGFRAKIPSQTEKRKIKCFSGTQVCNLIGASVPKHRLRLSYNVSDSLNHSIDAV